MGGISPLTRWSPLNVCRLLTRFTSLCENPLVARFLENGFLDVLGPLPEDG